MDGSAEKQLEHEPASDDDLNDGEYFCQFIMGNPAGNPDSQPCKENGKGYHQGRHQEIDIAKRKGSQPGAAPPVQDIGKGPEKGGYDDEGTGIANRQMDGKMKGNDHEWHCDNPASDSEEGGKSSSGKPDQKQGDDGNIGFPFGWQATSGKEHFCPHQEQHDSEDPLEMPSREKGGDGGSQGGTAGASDGQIGDMPPVDIAVSPMGQGTAAGGGNDDAETGAEGGMDQALGGESGQGKTPEEEGYEDDTASDPEKAGTESGQGTAGAENENDFRGENRHGESKKASPEGLALVLNGGPDQIRTGDGGFADLCLTTWRRGRQRQRMYR
jgi:hypothetical protein